MLKRSARFHSFFVFVRNGQQNLRSLVHICLILGPFARGRDTRARKINLSIIRILYGRENQQIFIRRRSYCHRCRVRRALHNRIAE